MATKIIYAATKSDANTAAAQWHALGYKVIGVGPSDDDALLDVSGDVKWSSPPNQTGYIVIATTEPIAGPS